MNKTIISIIVPVYNVEQYLNRCIDSILKQSFKDYEVILVDDGSRDTSGKMCDVYALKYENFHVIHKENAGLGYARNSGLDIATGKYVVFVDSDDYLCPDMLEVMHSEMVEHEADTCIGGHCRVRKSAIETIENPLRGSIFYGKEVLDKLLVKMTGKLPNGTDYIEMSVWKVIFSADIIKEHNIRFPSERKLISEDIIFNLEYYSYSNCVYISDNYGYCYCENEESLTTSYRNNRFELNKVLYNTLSLKLKSMGLYEKCKVRIQNNFISNVRHCVKLEVKFAKKNGKKKSLVNIYNMCSDKLVQDVMNEFPNKEVLAKPRFLNFLIKHIFVRLIVVSTKLSS